MSERNNRLAVIALIISLLSLVLSIYSLFLEDEIVSPQQSSQTVVTPNREITTNKRNTDTSSVNLQERLQTISNAIDPEDEATLKNASLQINQLRQDLGQSFSQAEGNVQQNWQSLDVELAQIGTQLEQGSIEAIDGLQILLDRLKTELEN